MNNIKMTLQDKHHFERTENHFKVQLVNWDEVEIVKEEDLPPQARGAFQQYLSKIALEREMQTTLMSPLVRFFDDYILELLMDYHYNVLKTQELDKDKRNNYQTIYSVVKDEYNRRRK